MEPPSARTPDRHAVQKLLENKTAEEENGARRAILIAPPESNEMHPVKAEPVIPTSELVAPAKYLTFTAPPLPALVVQPVNIEDVRLKPLEVTRPEYTNDMAPPSLTAVHPVNMAELNETGLAKTVEEYCTSNAPPRAAVLRQPEAIKFDTVNVLEG
jgi:hypothetical protein